MRRVNVALAAAIAAGLGAIGATVWVGARVREETVVAKPYEEGLGQDADRRARAALGLSVSILDEPLETGGRRLRFALADRAGRPVEDARIAVALSRPETSRGVVAAQARAEGGGRYAAEAAFPAPGPWDIRFDVVVPEGRVRLERRVAVRAACDLAAGPCTRPLEGGGEVAVELGPRPIRTMREIAVRVEVRGAGAISPPLPDPLPRSASLRGGEGDLPSTSPPLPDPLPRSASLRGGEGDLPTSTRTSTSTSTQAAVPSRRSPLPPRQRGERSGEGGAPTPNAATPVTLSFSMPSMDMGENRVTLSPVGGGVFEGKAVLVLCPSGRRDWVVDVEVPGPGAARRTARFLLALPEEGR